MPEISEADLKSLNDAKTQLDTLTQKSGKLEGELDTLKTAKVSLERKLDDADTELLSENYLNFKSGKGKSKEADESGDDFDFDRASGKELAAHLNGLSKKDLEKAVNGIGDRIAKTEEMMGKSFAQIDVTLTALRHTDFETNKDAIYKVAKDNPSWGAEKCYTQWKMEDKATADKKVEDNKAKEDE